LTFQIEPCATEMTYPTVSRPARDDAPALVGDASGWTWTAKVWRDTYQWTRLAFDRPRTGGRLDSTGISGAQALRPHPRRRRNLAAHDRTAGKGWVLIGDAAATLDPTSSHGVLKAVVSGMTAGHLVAAVLDGKAPADSAVEAYHEWLAQWFAIDAEKLAFIEISASKGSADAQAVNRRQPPPVRLNHLRGVGREVFGFIGRNPSPPLSSSSGWRIYAVGTSSPVMALLRHSLSRRAGTA
jgi:hypothetical protein